MRKIRGWVGNNEITPVQVAKPSSLIFQLNDSIVSLKWIAAIGCVEGYKIYGSKSVDSLELIGETNTNTYTKQLSQNDNPYFIAVSTFYQNIESEKTAFIKVCDEVVVNNSKQFADIEYQIISEPVIKQMIFQPQQIISDIDQMDELLRQNSAYVGIGGVLVNNRRL